MDVHTHRFPVGDGAPAVEIRNPSGSVSVAAVEGADEFVVDIEALDSAAEQNLDDVEVQVLGSRLRVVAPERRLFRSGSFAVRVTAPSGTAARVAAASADADLTGDLGKVEVTSASGDCVVESCTDLQLRTASGDARVGTVSGRAVVGTASGDLRVESVGAGLEARTASGDVEVGSAGGDVGVTTASGDVEIDRVSGGRVGVKTVSGDVSIAVAPGLKVWLDLSSLSGRMDSHLDAESAGDDGPAQLNLSVRTVSGDQRILRAAGAAPAV
jgi:hypothetical protein